jgi:hypothetical protein
MHGADANRANAFGSCRRCQNRSTTLRGDDDVLLWGLVCFAISLRYRGSLSRSRLIGRVLWAILPPPVSGDTPIRLELR